MDQYKGQILIVDDDELTLELIAASFEEEGYRVTTESTLDGLRARVQQRTYSFILVDLFLGDENALDAMPFLMRNCPYSSIIIMSANGTISWAVSAMEKGAASFLCKTKDAGELIEAIRSKEKVRHHGLPEHEDDFGLVGTTDSMRVVRENIDRFAKIDSTVLIEGESGTGKELVARALHARSERTGHFEAINCGAVPKDLLESELFGHVRGAFTGADRDHKGLFEVCSGGTLFLDELAEMPEDLQVKLLRVLQEGEVRPVGGSRTIKVSSRVVGATNRNLKEEVSRGNFRQDLYYRLAVLRIELPALRDRRDDIPLLIEHFLEKYNTRFNRKVGYPDKALQARLMAHPWPGNVRELQNSIERGVVMSVGENFDIKDVIDAPIGNSLGGLRGLVNRPLSEAKHEFEKNYLEELLEITGGNISEMSRLSGRYRADIYRLLSKYGVSVNQFRGA